MPELIVLRHAKSDWGTDAASDRERPLAKRGVKAATRVGRFLTAVGAVPDLVLSSPAVRARTTVELAAEAGGWTAPVEIVDGFYGGVWSDVVDGVLATAGGAGRVLVAGHEPTWSDLVSVLVGGGAVAMPTAAAACILVDGNGWSRLGPGSGELCWLVTPRMLKPLL
jgi:phosphohistidine phosphatase